MPRTISEQHWPAKNGILPEVKAWSLKISETLGWRSAFNAQHFTPVLCGHMGKWRARHPPSKFINEAAAAAFLLWWNIQQLEGSDRDGRLLLEQKRIDNLQQIWRYTRTPLPHSSSCSILSQASYCEQSRRKKCLILCLAFETCLVMCIRCLSLLKTFHCK